MSKFRMTDVFNLPVTKEREVCILEDRTPIMIAALLLNKEYVFHAINSHDQLVDTITKQEKVISELSDLAYEFISTLSSIGNDCGAEDTKDFVDNLLAKHKQSKGE